MRTLILAVATVIIAVLLGGCSTQGAFSSKNILHNYPPEIRGVTIEPIDSLLTVNYSPYWDENDYGHRHPVRFTFAAYYIAPQDPAQQHRRVTIGTASPVSISQGRNQYLITFEDWPHDWDFRQAINDGLRVVIGVTETLDDGRFDGGTWAWQNGVTTKL